jgi:Uncharacterised methyltransferase family (DUF6094)
MALMFPRLARNFIKNGYFPTDDVTLERVLNALGPATEPVCILDPCAGEGVALAEVAAHLGIDQVHSYAVEYDTERAAHARSLVNHCLQADLMDTFITRQSFGLLWLNPPYGDLPRDHLGGREFQGRARLEKLFYKRAVPLLQKGGLLIYIVPGYSLDKELVGWLTKEFADLRVYRAVDPQFKQVVIFGRRVRARELSADSTQGVRAQLVRIGCGDRVAEELPVTWPDLPYSVPAAREEPKDFFSVKIDPAQMACEVQRLQGLWPDLETMLGSTQKILRAPARALSQWHLALALAAGAISGVVRSQAGRVLIVKGDTHKDKTSKTEFTENEDGSITEVRILTDRFVPVIRAWDMTPDSLTFGDVLTIS